jgi:hypothetical protein
MVQKFVSNSLNEDLEAVGLNATHILGMADRGSHVDIDKDDIGEVSHSGEEVDPLCAEDVNNELFDRIEGLPFEKMEAEDIEEILEELKSKNLPEDNEELKERAAKLVDFLISEAAASRTRRFKAGSMSKKTSFQCPQGARQDPKNPRRCVPARKAAGGAGKLAKEGRKKKKWAKGGSGKKSSRKSGRYAARREDVGGMVSPFAMELGGLLEGAEENEIMEVRDEILDRIGFILEMLSEEFLDESVTNIFIEAYEPISEAWYQGRLDEDVMEEEEFMTMIKPTISIITKSLARIDSGELGNE